jgi:hypothetical protein
LAAAPCHVLASESLLGPRLYSLRDEQLLLWAAMPPELPEIGPHVGGWRHFSNARAAAHLIDELFGEIGRFPEGETDRLEWRERLRERLQRFGQERLGWPDGYRKLLFGDAFYESSIAFARAARAFDPGLSLEQLGQALRNVWIGNSLQMLLDEPVAMRPGLFAYSMLYPVTDNWLDDPSVSSADKRAFNRRFGWRLAGRPGRALGARGGAAFRLVETIEGELPRADFPRVYESLLAIHEAQSRSLDQQDGTKLSEAELLAISVEKGGSSVLTDLHLVTQTPRPSEERFAFGFGVFLQLLDDLQDVEDDLAAGHETLFTRAARLGPLDEPTARLARFIDVVLEGGPFPGPGFADRLDLVRRNCRALLVGTVAEHPRRFSRPFRQRLAAQWPVSFRAHRRLRRRAFRCWRRLAAGHGRAGFSSLLGAAGSADVAAAQAPRSTNHRL